MSLKLGRTSSRRHRCIRGAAVVHIIYDGFHAAGVANYVAGSPPGFHLSCSIHQIVLEAKGLTTLLSSCAAAGGAGTDFRHAFHNVCLPS